ncbi:hypothetical protein F5Y10DRAFT_235193 [Nemania abortiva]|nr:hypothetical protein F5Y10DRAFT_235193 [Nemania abortiva]
MSSYRHLRLYPAKPPPTKGTPHQPSYKCSVNGLGFLKKRLAKVYLDEDDLAALKIECSNLDFDPTPCPPDAGALLNPMPAQKMERLAREYELASLEGTGPFENNSFNEASILNRRIDSYLRRFQQPDDVDCLFLIDNSVYRKHGFSSVEAPLLGCFRYSLGRLFQVQHVLEVRDRSSSHVTCFLSEDAPLRGDALMLSEVWTILAIASLYFHRLDSGKFKIIPVTVISVSGRQFRIVQGYADGETEIIHIRKTRIVDLGYGEDPEKEHWSEIMTLMRWVLAEPCGKTTYD